MPLVAHTLLPYRGHALEEESIHGIRILRQIVDGLCHSYTLYRSLVELAES